MMYPIISIRGRAQKGLAAVEMLIAVPVLMMVLMSITEFGNAFIQYATLNKMAQSGVRYATAGVTGTATYDQIADVNEIKNMVVYGHTGSGTTSLMSGISTSDVSVNHSSGYVTITINHTYTPLISGFNSSINFSVPLNASAMMRTAP
ncbi:TadE/TadG family type IV pilus assembly protein [Vibrio sp. T11.5]|uniref:TadE/TadG family type IV pilus assembly protein n=1 Tax=Vibrio sp. T11.5 TaxID=2998836 RepID=UPI0022CD8A74|nr:TadE/TadG family type IV pilus assembly protein [Vibrio sp. T11.5]MDA0118946.1 pilus assembly protein [Vibrio sp. T11.5]